MRLIATFLMFLFFRREALAYPIFAQKAYSNPKEESGRIVCANCHLATKPVSLKAPQSILPSQIFTVEANIPIEPNTKQVLRNRNLGNLNARRVLILPDRFKIARKKGFFQPYNAENPNILVVRPLPAKQRSNLKFSIKAPDKFVPRTNSIYFRRNRRRRQIYPDREKSNNNPVLSPVKRVISDIRLDENKISIFDNTSKLTTEVDIPKRLLVKVNKNQEIDVNDSLTNNPNVGRFGQSEVSIVLQDSNRLIALQIFLASIFFAQISLILKKKQIELVN